MNSKFEQAILRYKGGRRQLLGRAVGLKPHYFPAVIDATAGFGRDGLILASLGCRVTLVERMPEVAELVRATLARAKEAMECEIELVESDAISYLQQLAPEQWPEVVYLDPMYPERRKSALNKKEMRMLRELVGDDTDAPQLLTAARRIARKRVVVKRPRLAPFLGAQHPDLQFKGKSSRFDVYLP